MCLIFLKFLLKKILNRVARQQAYVNQTKLKPKCFNLDNFTSLFVKKTVPVPSEIQKKNIIFN